MLPPLHLAGDCHLPNVLSTWKSCLAIGYSAFIESIKVTQVHSIEKSLFHNSLCNDQICTILIYFVYSHFCEFRQSGIIVYPLQKLST